MHDAYIHIYIHTHIQTHTHTYMNTYIHIYKRIHIHTYIHTCSLTYSPSHLLSYLHAYIHTGPVLMTVWFKTLPLTANCLSLLLGFERRRGILQSAISVSSNMAEKATIVKIPNSYMHAYTIHTHIHAFTANTGLIRWHLYYILRILYRVETRMTALILLLIMPNQFS